MAKKIGDKSCQSNFEKRQIILVFSELSNYYCKYAFMVSQGIFQMMIHEYIMKNQWQKNKNYPSEIMPSHDVNMIKGELGLPDKCPYR